MVNQVQAQEPELLEGDPASIDESTFFDKLRRALGRIPFAADVLAMYFAMRDPRTPTWVKALIAGASVRAIPGEGYTSGGNRNLN